MGACAKARSNRLAILMDLLLIYYSKLFRSYLFVVVRMASAAVFWTAAAILSVTAPVETVHAHQPPEAERKVEVEI